MNHTYKVEDIFEDDPDNPDNVLMTIPEEILKEVGWRPGDTVIIEQRDDGSIMLSKKEE
jgi:hypothetical protein